MAIPKLVLAAISARGKPDIDADAKALKETIGNSIALRGGKYRAAGELDDDRGIAADIVDKTHVLNNAVRKAVAGKYSAGDRSGGDLGGELPGTEYPGAE